MLINGVNSEDLDYFSRVLNHLPLPFKEFEVKKLYYSIGEVAKIFDVSRSLIRYWETEFDTIKPSKNRKGNRNFTDKDIEAIKKVYHLVKVKKYTLDGAKKHLKQNKGIDNDKFDVVMSLQKVRKQLVLIRDGLAFKKALE